MATKYMFRFFGMSIVTDDGKARSMAFREFQTFMEFLGLRKYVVPVLGIFKSFDDACRMPNNGITTFYDEKHRDTMEGVVIQPWLEEPVTAEWNLRFKKQKH